MGQVNQFLEQSSDSEQESYGDQDLEVINLDSWIALRQVSRMYTVRKGQCKLNQKITLMVSSSNFYCALLKMLRK
jgi:hypothetical protein